MLCVIITNANHKPVAQCLLASPLDSRPALATSTEAKCASSAELSNYEVTSLVKLLQHCQEGVEQLIIFLFQIEELQSVQ